MDTIKTFDEGCRRILRYARRGHVVFEGLLCSGIYQRFTALAADSNELFVRATLDTPLKLCLSRVEMRRRERGITKPLNPKNTISKHYQVHRVAARAYSAGEYVVYVDHNRAAQQVYELLSSRTIEGKFLANGYRYEEGRRIALDGMPPFSPNHESIVKPGLIMEARR